MRLNGYTIIEGIVSMVILSILLSVAIIVTFNFYQAFPSRGEMEMKEILKMELDSLSDHQIHSSYQYSIASYAFSYEVKPFQEFEHLYQAEGTLSDSLGHSYSDHRILLVYED